MMRSSNPALLSNPFSTFGRYGTGNNTMTMGGTVTKTGLLLLLVLLPATFVWTQFFSGGHHAEAITGYLWGGLIGGLVAGLVTVFKKEWAAISAPIYSVMQGLFLGGISAIFEASYPGIVMQAVSLTMATTAVMLVAYQTGWIRATEPFKRGVVAATGGIFLVYLASIVLGLFGVSVPFVYGGGIFGIAFSVFVVGIAALNLVLDFDFIEKGSAYGAPKYMEWYGAFALMVTLIWLYLEMLRLIAKINSRR